MTELITTPAELDALNERIRQAPRVAIDTEFHQERSYSARLMVVQLAFADGVAIVDALAVTDLRSMIEALNSTLVVGHALSGDLRIFADRYDLVPQRIFDCQIAAAFCGFGQSISLLDLVQSLAGVRLRKSQTVSDWSQRPFSAKQLEYLVDDVAYLFQLQDRLQERLEAAGRTLWAQEEMQPLGQIEYHRSDPERLYLRLQGASRLNRRDLGVLREIAQLRDRLARERDVPPKYIFADDVLTGMAALRPRSIDELAQLRRLETSARKMFGPAIIAAVDTALTMAEDDLPQRPVRPVSLHREAIVALCAVLVNAIAAAHDLPSALLAPRAAIERLVRELPKSQSELSAVLELSPWRVELLAQPLLALLWGQTTLGITGSEADAPQVVALTSKPAMPPEPV